MNGASDEYTIAPNISSKGQNGDIVDDFNSVQKTPEDTGDLSSSDPLSTLCYFLDFDCFRIADTSTSTNDVQSDGTQAAWIEKRNQREQRDNEQVPDGRKLKNNLKQLGYYRV